MKQLLITGKQISIENAMEVRKFCMENNIFAVDWCHPNGEIGFIDGSKKIINEKILIEDLNKLVSKFSFLEIGISLMSDIPGKPNCPIYQVAIIKNKIVRTHYPHCGHNPPKRYKQHN